MKPEDWMLIWTALSAIGQLIAFPALLFAAWTFFRSAKMQHYDELDDMYASLLATRFDNPESCLPSERLTAESRQKYFNHAYMTWNFIETVYDRIAGDSELNETWEPVVRYEAKLHCEWFNDPANRPRFKRRFIQRMKTMFPEYIVNTDEKGA